LHFVGLNYLNVLLLGRKALLFLYVYTLYILFGQNSFINVETETVLPVSFSAFFTEWK